METAIGCFVEGCNRAQWHQYFIHIKVAVKGKPESVFRLLLKSVPNHLFGAGKILNTLKFVSFNIQFYFISFNKDLRDPNFFLFFFSAFCFTGIER